MLYFILLTILLVVLTRSIFRGHAKRISGHTIHGSR